MKKRSNWIGLTFALGVTWIAGFFGCSDTQPGTRVAGESVDLSGVPQPEDRIAPQSANGLELDLISDLFFAALVVHPQQMLASESITAEQVRAFLGDWANSESVPVERCERILLLIPMITNPEQPMLPVAKLEFDSNVDLADILEQDQQEAFQRSPTDERLWMGTEGRAAAYQYGSNELLFGERGYVMSAVEDRLPRPGRLAGLMGALELDRDVIGVLNGEALATMMANLQPNPGGEAGVPPTALEFYFDLTDDPMGKLTVEVNSEEEAQAANDQFGQALKMTKFMGPMMVQSLTADAPSQTRTLLTKVVKEVLAGIQTGVDGNRVTVSAARPDQLPQAIAGFAEILIEARKVDARENKLKQVAQAMLKYHAQHDQFPRVAAELDESSDAKGLSWRVHLLPMLGHQELHDRFHFNEPWDSEHNLALVDEMPRVFDTNVTPGETTIVVMRGDQTAWSLDKSTRIKDILDGTAQTIMLIDAGSKKSITWTKPDEIVDDAGRTLVQQGIARIPTMLVATFDGKTHRVSRNVSDKDLRALLSPRGEEKVDYRRKLGIPDPNQRAPQIRPGGFPFGGF